VQASYDRLLAHGHANEAAAMQVGQTVEQADINGPPAEPGTAAYRGRRPTPAHRHRLIPPGV